MATPQRGRRLSARDSEADQPRGAGGRSGRDVVAMVAIGLVVLFAVVALLQGLIVKKIGFGPFSVELAADDRQTAQPPQPRPVEPTLVVEPNEDDSNIPVATAAPAASTTPHSNPSA